MIASCVRPCEILLASKVCSHLVHQLLSCTVALLADEYVKKELQSIPSITGFCVHWSTSELLQLFCHWIPLVVLMAGRQNCLIFIRQKYTACKYLFLSHNLAACKFDPAASPTTFSKQQRKLHNSFSNQHGVLEAVDVHAAEAFFLHWPTLSPTPPPHLSLPGLTTHSPRRRKSIYRASRAIDREHLPVPKRRTAPPHW